MGRERPLAGSSVAPQADGPRPGRVEELNQARGKRAAALDVRLGEARRHEDRVARRRRDLVPGLAALQLDQGVVQLVSSCCGVVTRTAVTGPFSSARRELLLARAVVEVADELRRQRDDAVLVEEEDQPGRPSSVARANSSSV